MRFDFAKSPRILFGWGSIERVGEIAAQLGKKAFLVHGHAPGIHEELVSSLSQQHILLSAYSMEGEPNLDQVRHALGQAREHQCDFVISIGGGSRIDTGKAVAAGLSNPGDLLEYLEVIGRGRKLEYPAKPHIAIPTTAGTGSEVTRNAVLFSPLHRMKASLRSTGMVPTIALIDPQLTVRLPPQVTAYTGMDTLTQLIEPYVSIHANPMTDALCRHGFHLIAWALRTAYHQSDQQKAREAMSLASLSGGLALASAGLGAVHGFASAIGGLFPVPHGVICGRLLAGVMEANYRALNRHSSAKQVMNKYREIATILTGDQTSSFKDGVKWVQRLTDELQVPRLQSYGILTAHINQIVEKAQQASSMKANPVQLSGSELEGILLKSL